METNNNTKEMVNLSIQIINYDINCLINCLMMIFSDLSTSKITFEINILDNNSSENLLGVLKKFFSYSFKFLNIYSCKKNIGFGEAHNILAEKANGEYLLLINPNTILTEENSIRMLYNRIKSDVLVKVIAPKICNEDGEECKNDHKEKNKKFEIFKMSAFPDFLKNQDDEINCSWVSGLFFLIEKKVFDKIGGFDKNYYIYEEIHLCKKIIKFNRRYQIIYYPRIKINTINLLLSEKEKIFPEYSKYFSRKEKFKEPFVRGQDLIILEKEFNKRKQET